MAIGALTGILLLCLGAKSSPTLALFAPSSISCPVSARSPIPAIPVALSDGPRPALYVALLFIVVQTIEGNVVAPLIQQRTVELPPIVTLLSQAVLGTVFGPMGLILATPITAAALVIVTLVCHEKVLGDEADIKQGVPSPAVEPR